MSKVFDAAEGNSLLPIRLFVSQLTSEVANHASPQSCWVILYGKVYDVCLLLPRPIAILMTRPGHRLSPRTPRRF